MGAKIMTNGISDSKAKWLTYLICFLLSVLAFLTGWQQVMVGQLEAEIRTFPEKYVRAPRYETDLARVESYFCRIDSKIDRLIERAATKAVP